MVTFARPQDQRVSLCMLLAVTGLTSGCAFTENRLRDAEDIFTMAGGFGLGSCVHAGPISTGIGAIWDVYGLSSGHFGENQMGHFSSGFTAQLVGIGTEDSWLNPEVRDRAKRFYADCYLIGLPDYEQGRKGNSLVPPYFFQFEVSAGLFGGLRAGFNLAELADFLLGFAGIDLLRDDVAGLQQVESSPDKAEAPPPGRK